MAPEQWSDSPEDERTDVFALGVLLFRIVTGTLPFADDGGKSLRGPEPAPQLEVSGAPALGPLVARMLTKDPAARTRDGGAVLAELERIAAALPRAAPAGVAPVVVSRPHHRSRRPSARSDPPSVAVLPFVDMSPQKDQEYFADGVAEEILNALAHVDGLRVVGRTSSFSFKGKNDDLRDISAKLGVRNVLEGSVRKQGDRVRVTTQLVSAADGSHVWSESYDRDLEDIFAVQDEIARAVVSALRVKLLSASGASRGAITVNREAYDEYLFGRELFRRAEPDAVKRALAAYEKAVSLDAGSALAWAGLSEAIIFLEEFAGEGVHPEQRRRALDAAERVIALAPDLPAGYTYRSTARLHFLQDWEGARDDAEQARALGPNDAEATLQYGKVLTVLGRLREAVAAMTRTTEIDPLSYFAWCFLGFALVSAGEHGRARAALARALEISPRGDLARHNLLVDLAAANQPEEALAEAEKASWGWVRNTGVAIAQHDLGHAGESQAALEAVIKGNAVDAPCQIAEIYAWRGENDSAFAWLERARVQADTGLGWIKTNPLLRIRGDPRYAAFLTKMKLPAD